MAKTKRVIMKVRYNDGTVDKFSFNRNEDDVNLTGRFQQAAESNFLVMELEDRLLAIPMHSIRSIQISPKPGKLAPTVMRNVTRIQ
tara:strand:+ start:128 stop:385 length:258 start_codon:yes stop_codon:yes gene_type:complete